MTLVTPLPKQVLVQAPALVLAETPMLVLHQRTQSASKRAN